MGGATQHKDRDHRIENALRSTRGKCERHSRHGLDMFVTEDGGKFFGAQKVDCAPWFRNGHDVNNTCYPKHRAKYLHAARPATDNGHAQVLKTRQFVLHITYSQRGSTQMSSCGNVPSESCHDLNRYRTFLTNLNLEQTGLLVASTELGARQAGH